MAPTELTCPDGQVKFLDSQDIHMFLCSHFIYSPRTRIITFSQKKPTPIMYKEMPPLKLIIE